MSKHLAKFEAYAEARREYDRLNKLSSEADAARKKLEQELVDIMIEEGVKSFKITGGMTISLRKRFDCSVNKDNEEQVADWLQNTYGDVRQFQKLVLYKPAVVARLKEQDEDGKLDPTMVPEFLNLKTTPGVTVRGWQGPDDE